MTWQGSGSQDWNTQQQNILQNTQATLENTSRSLANSHRVAIETEEIGYGNIGMSWPLCWKEGVSYVLYLFLYSTAVIAELGQQRETLLRTRQRVTDTDEELGRARSTLRKISYQVASNKLLLILIIVTEVAILCALIYMRLRK